MARYIQTLGHKLDVLRELCKSIGRDYDSIEKTTSLAIPALAVAPPVMLYWVIEKSRA
jgi:hypothetical protein